jgi:hypothetical protein
LSPESSRGGAEAMVRCQSMLAERLRTHDETHDEAPRDDHVVIIDNAAWSDYQRVLELRGDRPVPRVAYLEGVLQLMSPSKNHEALKSLIGQLVEV